MAYYEADWASSADDKRSTSGMCIYLGSNLVTWFSKKQPIVSRSSTKAKYKSIPNATAELAWFQSLLTELHITFPSSPIIWSDNIGSISIFSNPVHHSKTKHIRIDQLFVREKVQDKLLQIQYVPLLDQLVDTFTKPLPLS